MMRKLLLSSILLWSITSVPLAAQNGAIQAGTLKAAMAAYKSGNVTEAVKQLLVLAHEHNGDAQLNLSVILAKGDGILQNEKRALYWAWRARFVGQRDSIGVIDYLSSRVADKDKQHIAEDLKNDLVAIVDNGNTDAALWVGRTYNETYVEADKQSAYVWFSLASAWQVKYANAFRKAIEFELNSESRNTAQKTTAVLMSQWCIRQQAHGDAPDLCNLMSELGNQ